MRTWMAVLGVAMTSGAWAQDTVISRATELGPSPDGYVYDADGRRDPFTDLRQKPTSDIPTIDALGLRGIVKTRDGRSALLVDATGRAVVVRVGARIYDAVVVALDDRGVTFRQDLTDPLRTADTREVRKTLRD